MACPVRVAFTVFVVMFIGSTLGAAPPGDPGSVGDAIPINTSPATPATPATQACGDYFDVTLLIEIILSWGPCVNETCPGDLTGDGEVNVEDLLEAILNWRPRLDLRVGPIDGLTSEWQVAPAAAAIPVGTVMTLHQDAPDGATVLWTGATETNRDPSGSTAVCTPEEAGEFMVRAEVTCEGESSSFEEAFECMVTAMDFPLAEMTVMPVTVSVAPFDIDVTLPQEELNLITTDYFFGPSIAALRDLGDGRYRTSVNRLMTLAVDVEPAPYATLMEWRVNDHVLSHGSVFELPVTQAGVFAVDFGRPETPSSVEIETYEVTITSHTAADEVPEGEPLLFTAETNPPGFEDDITWLASTSYGTGLPVLGSGPEFVVQFDDTWGPMPDDPDSEVLFQWLGVKADHVAFNQDGKFGGCCLPDLNCVNASQQSCENMGGEFLDFPCGFRQPCSLPDGSCVEVNPPCCVLQGGTTVECCGPDEACCFPDGSCEDLGAECCLASAGFSLGPGTSCAVEECLDLVGCCLPSGSCDTVSSATCDASGGTALDTFCTSSKSCCLSDGSCVLLDPACCEIQGGVPGELDTCDTRACCLPDNSCIVTTSACCQMAGGTPGGPGSDCDDPVVACCLPDGSCVDLNPFCCENAGGTSGTMHCTESASCCLPDGSCIEVNPACCAISGGAAGDPGSTCGALRACCFVDGGCEDLQEECCLDSGGIPLGQGTSCASDMCPEAGGCCLPSGQCQNLLGVDCDAMGGTQAGVPCFAPRDCCFADGSCIVIDPACCELQGGTSGNFGACPLVQGCCLPDGSCLDLVAACCLAEGGTPTATVCSTNLFGCCLPDGSCLTLSTQCCSVMGGTVAPVGTCDEPLASCCLADGSCVELRLVCCFAAGGTNGAPGSTCGGIVACCFTFECQDLAVDCCLIAGGTPLGEGTQCADLDCDLIQLCCVPDGSCVNASEEDCIAMGGTSVTGALCEATQACRFSDDSCADLDPLCCALTGGLSEGPGTSCETRCRYTVGNVASEGGCADCPLQDGDILCSVLCDLDGECLPTFDFTAACTAGQCTGTATFEGCLPCPVPSTATTTSLTLQTEHGPVIVTVYRDDDG